MPFLFRIHRRLLGDRAPLPRSLGSLLRHPDPVAGFKRRGALSWTDDKMTIAGNYGTWKVIWVKSPGKEIQRKRYKEKRKEG